MIVRTEEEIQATIGKINERLQEKTINKPVNKSVKEGYKEVLHILCERITQKDDIPNRVQSIQGRFIAWIGVDYLTGDCSESVLLGVPIKDEKR